MASDPESGLDLVYDLHPQIVLTDLVMPGISGMEVLERIMEFDPATDVILMTAHYSTESAVEAIRKGASDYLNKPISIATLRQRIGRLVEEARRRQRTLQLEDELLAGCEFEGIVGNSPLMWDMFSKIRRIAPHYRAVLVTGADRAPARTWWRARCTSLSPASRGRYVVLNCSAVVETLFESELFGHVKGAFTGATQDKMGLFEHAHGGTLFLDEIGDMPLATQAKLLRALQNQEIQRVGSLSATESRRARGRGHPPGSAHRYRREAVPRRPVLPAVHGGDPCTRAGRAQGRSAAAASAALSPSSQLSMERRFED